MSTGTPAPALEAIGLTKRFGATAALDDVSLSIAPGEVHALLGHNGSGKSTLVKVLSGYHRADSGTVRFGGQPARYPLSQAALRAMGVSFVHQDLGLVPAAPVLENMFIGRFQTGALGRIRWRAERSRLEQLLASFRVTIDPDAPVSSLSAVQRTLVGLVRAFTDVAGRDGGLLVLDEVTSSLQAREIDDLAAAVREVSARGVAVLLVTHHLNEPLLLADRVSVLRDGRLVATADVNGKTERHLAEMVLGEQRKESGRRHPRREAGPVALDVDAVSGAALHNAGFRVRAGEVLGLTGLAGSGYDDVPHLLYGARRGTARFTVGDRACRRPAPSRCRDMGMALVSGDRARAGGVLPATLAENLSAPVLRSLTGPLPRISRRREAALVGTLVGRFGIRPGSPDITFSNLSGGNQQKALLGRWMTSPPKVLLLDEPTTGIDVGAVDALLEILDDYVRGGGAVVMASAQYEDLSRVADRVLVFEAGRVTAELQGAEITPHNLLMHCYGAAGGAGAAPRTAAKATAQRKVSEGMP